MVTAEEQEGRQDLPRSSFLSPAYGVRRKSIARSTSPSGGNISLRHISTTFFPQPAALHTQPSLTPRPRRLPHLNAALRPLCFLPLPVLAWARQG